MRSQLYLAELWFAKSESLALSPKNAVNINTHTLPTGNSGYVYRDALGRVIAHHAAGGPFQRYRHLLSGSVEHTYVYGGKGPFVLPTTTFSVVHWAAANDVGPDYVRHALTKEANAQQTQPQLSLLVSASLNKNEDNGLLRVLLGSGASPNERVEVRVDAGTLGETTASATPWMVFCVYFVACMTRKGVSEKDKRRLGSNLEDFLTTRKVDTDCLVLLVVGAQSESVFKIANRLATHCIHFRQLVEQSGLPNHDRLMALMGDSGKPFWNTFSSWWNYGTASKPAHDDRLSSQASLYLPFHVGMQPPPGKKQGESGGTFVDEEMFFVESVKWVDDRLAALKHVFSVC
jgi:hypothetical protein